MARLRLIESTSTLTTAFATSDDITRALATKDAPSLISALASIQQSAHALVTAEAPPALGQHPLHDFMNKYPTIDPIFMCWDLAHRTNNSSLTSAVLNCLGSLVRLASQNAQRGEPEFVRRLLGQYSTHLKRALNPGRNDTTVAVLKLLNVVVAFGSGRFARRAFDALPWASKTTARLFKTRLQDNTRDPLHRPDIRTLLVMLVLSFLSMNDARLKCQVLETRGLLSGMIKGLSDDPPPVVHHVLVAFYRDVIVARSVGLGIRRALLDEANLKEVSNVLRSIFKFAVPSWLTASREPIEFQIVKLYDTVERSDEWIESHNGSPTSGVPRLGLTVHAFLSAVVGWLGDQIDEAPARSAGAQRTLGTLLIALKVTEDARQRDLALRVLQRAPNLVVSYWAKFPASFDPRLSSRWISAITWATQITSLPLPQELSAESTLPINSALVDSVCPSALNRLWFTKAMQQNDPMVAYLSATLLLAMLQKATRVLIRLAEIARQCEETETVGKWISLARTVRLRLQAIVPDPQIIMALSAVPSTPSAPAPVTSTSRKKLKLQSGSGAAVETDHVDTIAQVVLNQPRHLRFHIALRLLWMYHRVTPRLITALRYDFGKLLHRPWSTSGSPGIETVTSGYALRVASLHTTAVVWVRPTEVLKTVLSPLLQRLRTTVSEGNRVLLLMILTRVLRTPLLFGDNLDEASDWLEALMWITRNSPRAGSDAALAFFEDCVQKALAWSSAASNVPELRAAASPLLRVVQGNLRRQLEYSARPAESTLRLVRLFFFSKLGSIDSLSLLKQVVGGFTASLVEMELVAETTLRVLEECLLVIQGKVVRTRTPCIDELLANDSRFDATSLPPLTFDVYHPALQRATWYIPTSLLMLHLSPPLVRDAATLKFTLARVRGARAWLAAVRVLLLRIAGSGNGVFAWMVISLYEDCPSPVQRNRIQTLVSGSDIIPKALASSEEPEQLSAMLHLVRVLFSPNNPDGRRAAMPYCQLIIGNDEAKLSPRLLLTSGPLMPFFGQPSLLRVTASLLRHVANDTLSMDHWTRATLDAALLQCSSVSSVAVMNELWVQHFATLCSLAQLSHPVKGCEAVLLHGASFLSSSDRNKASQIKSLLDCHAVDWTRYLLATVATNRSFMVVLVQLVSRSEAARALFESFVATQKRLDLAYAAPLSSMVSTPVKEPDVVDALRKLIVEWTKHLIAANNSTPTVIDEAAFLVGTYAVQNSDLARSVVLIVEGALPQSTDQVFSHRPVRFLSQLAHHMPAAQSVLGDWVNNSFEGIIRYTMEHKEDEGHICDLVSELVRTLKLHRTIVCKQHLFDPLLTAIIHHRQDQSDYSVLAAMLCSLSDWKDQDVARHLNALLATPAFRSQSQHRAGESSIRLIAALARASWTAAASCRLVDRLIPIYGATTSAQDVVIHEIFQRLELEHAGSINAASKRWSPDTGNRILDKNRCASLHHLDPRLMRNAWLQACGSALPPTSEVVNFHAYDPGFLLPFVSHTIAEDELRAADWTNLLKSGALGIPIAALASPSPNMRQLALSTLQAALNKSRASEFPERDELALVLHMSRQCIYRVNGEPVPAVISLFLCCCILALGTPASTLYPAFMQFLLQRSQVDQHDVPMFYATLYSSSALPEEERRWLVLFLGHGLMRTQASLGLIKLHKFIHDWRILRRRQSFELVVSLFESAQHDYFLRLRILQFFLSGAKIPKVARELVRRNGLLFWITTVPLVDKKEHHLALQILGKVNLALPGSSGSA